MSDNQVNLEVVEQDVPRARAAEHGIRISAEQIRDIEQEITEWGSLEGTEYQQGVMRGLGDAMMIILGAKNGKL